VEGGTGRVDGHGGEWETAGETERAGGSAEERLDCASAKERSASFLSGRTASSIPPAAQRNLTIM
jgi:hypothetical protein